MLSKTKDLDCLKEGLHFGDNLSVTFRWQKFITNILKLSLIIFCLQNHLNWWGSWAWEKHENLSKLQRQIKQQNIKDDDVSFSYYFKYIMKLWYNIIKHMICYISYLYSIILNHNPRIATKKFWKKVMEHVMKSKKQNLTYDAVVPGQEWGFTSDRRESGHRGGLSLILYHRYELF